MYVLVKKLSPYQQYKACSLFSTQYERVMMDPSYKGGPKVEGHSLGCPQLLFGYKWPHGFFSLRLCAMFHLCLLVGDKVEVLPLGSFSSFMGFFKGSNMVNNIKLMNSTLAWAWHCLCESWRILVVRTPFFLLLEFPFNFCKNITWVLHGLILDVLDVQAT